MATLRILIFFILHVYVLSCNFALSLVTPPTQGTIPVTNPTSPTPSRPPPTTSGGLWCIANPTASQTALQVALDYACGYGGADCSAIQPSGACFDPSTVRDHASYAFNSYYQKNPVPTSCAFGREISRSCAGYGNCRFASSSATPKIPTGTPPAISTTPTTQTPIVPMTPTTPTVEMRPPSSIATPAYPNSMSGGNGYGSEPAANDYGSITAGNPNQAGSRSANIVVFIIMNSLILPVTVAIHF